MLHDRLEKLEELGLFLNVQGWWKTYPHLNSTSPIGWSKTSQTQQFLAEFRSRFAMFENLHSIAIFESLYAIIHFFPARVIIHFPLHFILFNPNSPIKPTRLIYKIFGPLYIFIVNFIFPTLANKPFLPYTIESKSLSLNIFLNNTLKLACLKGKLSCR